MITLKGGFTTADPRLDRVPQFDQRNLSYPVRPMLAAAGLEQRRSMTWPCSSWLDQGQEGACVGFGWSHELASVPAPVKGLSADFARSIYHRAQQIDEWPGEAYSGTSVLAGAKAAQEAGYIGEYRWATSIDDIVLTLGNHGPVVLGIDWKDSMFSPRPSGLLDCSGIVSGGHCILARGVLLRARLKGEGRVPIEVVRLRNSWGTDWGLNGDCFMKVEDLQSFITTGGDACVPVVRYKTKQIV